MSWVKLGAQGLNMGPKGKRSFKSDTKKFVSGIEGTKDDWNCNQTLKSVWDLRQIKKQSFLDRLRGRRH